MTSASTANTTGALVAPFNVGDRVILQQEARSVKGKMIQVGTAATILNSWDRRAPATNNGPLAPADMFFYHYRAKIRFTEEVKLALSDNRVNDRDLLDVTHSPIKNRCKKDAVCYLKRPYKHQALDKQGVRITTDLKKNTKITIGGGPISSPFNTETNREYHFHAFIPKTVEVIEEGSYALPHTAFQLASG